MTDPSPARSSDREWLLTAKPVWRLIVLSILFTAGLAIRIYGIGEYPLDYHPTKQYRSALTARAYYYESVKSIPEWQREVARASVERLG